MIQYECSHCHGIFVSDEEEDAALKESEEVWGKLPIEQLSRVCDDCYQKIMKWYNEQKTN